jgi:hypothetical protein
MFAFLRALGLSPIEWSTAITMTGSGAPYIGEVLDAAFNHAQAVLVLLTPDEITYLRSEYATDDADPETQPATQARPNVLFEAGMALGRHPNHTIIVEIGELRPFSDILGRHSVRITNDAIKRQELRLRLQAAGCAVDTSGTDWLSAGDFTAPASPGAGLPLGRRTPSTRIQKRVDFDARYFSSGRDSGRLQVINRGMEPALKVAVHLPEGAVLGFPSADDGIIPKIPGGGKSVSLPVSRRDRFFGGANLYDRSFDVTVTCQLEDGGPFSQDVFLDASEG